MDYKKSLLIIISVVMVLLIPIIIYAYNFDSVAFDKDFYQKEFLKQDVYRNLDGYDVDKINNDVLNYLESKNNQLIKNNFFTEREKFHLLDVKNLIQKILVTYYFSLILFLLLFVMLIFLLSFDYKLIVERFFVVVFFGSLLTLIDAFLFFLLSNIDFNFVFDFFHKMLFSIGTYTFNPDFEKIVVLYPGNLFFAELIKIILKTILSSVIMLLVSLSVLFYFFKWNFLRFFSLVFRRKKH
jgi:uncharacterized membrane protein|tara:strand:+ start:78 stop:797 length:720 start_codon:yes stop_codon:yes gene_type:complete